MNADERIEPGVTATGRSPSPKSNPRPLAHVRAEGRARLPSRRAPDLPTNRLVVAARGLARRIGRRPLTSLFVATGVGFAVGGALSFRAGRIALGAATRHLARELLKQVI